MIDKGYATLITGFATVANPQRGYYTNNNFTRLWNCLILVPWLGEIPVLSSFWCLIMIGKCSPIIVSHISHSMLEFAKQKNIDGQVQSKGWWDLTVVPKPGFSFTG